MITLPGLIDIHVHLRTPGQSHKEDFNTGTKAALAGGFTTVLDMPNNKIPITTTNLLKKKIKIAKSNAVCDVGFHFGSLGENLKELKKVEKLTMGLKLYLSETTGNFLINSQKLKTIFQTWNGGPILVHAENETIAEVIKNVEETGKTAHICHISLKTDLEQIINAKEKGLPITCGVTPHHLFLSQDDVSRLGTYGKMKPTLKSKKDVAFLWEHLKAIDIIESDHAPHTKGEKDGNTPPLGIPGLETTLPLLLTAASDGKLTIEDILRLCHKNPKRIFHISNQDATVEIDENETYILKNEDLFTKCKWSPFAGRTMHGRVKKVTIRKTLVFENGKILVHPGSGQVIKPS